MSQLLTNLLARLTELANMESSDQLKGDGTYEPTVLDVLVVRAMLNKTLSLPPELIDDVIDWAEYWPHSTVVGDYRARPKTVTGGSRRSGPESAFLVSASRLDPAVHALMLVLGSLPAPRIPQAPCCGKSTGLG